MKTSKKLTIIFSIIVAIFTIGIVFKQFQNDTFFNISIGKYILENGIDMQEHFSWVQGLSYTYSHWAFDIVIYLLYNAWEFNGIYIATIVFSIITNIILYNLLNKRCKSPIVALLITLITSFIIRECYTARSQIISFLCFIIEIYCIEQLIETNKKKYAITLIILSIIVANFHAATWPLFLVLFMPYVAAAFLNGISSRNIYTIMKNRAQKKLDKLSADSSKRKQYEEDVMYYSKFINELKTPKYSKIIRRDNYNAKVLIILMIIICFTGLITPIHGTPYTYVLKSMFGVSNIENHASIDFVDEMQPLVLVRNLSVLIFLIFFIIFLVFTPSKLKMEHGFLILGLLLMTLTSSRYMYLLIFLGSYIIADLMSQSVNEFIPKDIKTLEKICTLPIVYIVLFIITSAFSICCFIPKTNTDYVNNKIYPVGAVEYIKNNLDYRNMRIYNDYIYGSYLMLNEIPVFIDSRLDVYCSEFNDTDVFYDYIQIVYGSEHYEDIFTRNDFTHILLYNNDIVHNYVKRDNNYKLLYEDEYFSLYERNVNN